MLGSARSLSLLVQNVFWKEQSDASRIRNNGGIGSREECPQDSQGLSRRVIRKIDYPVGIGRLFLERWVLILHPSIVGF